jgi:hypothetical protein
MRAGPFFGGQTERSKAVAFKMARSPATCDPRHCASLKYMACTTIAHEELEAAMSSLEDRRRSQRVATLTAVDLFFVLVWIFGGLV